MGAGWTSNENNVFMLIFNNVFGGSFLCTDFGSHNGAQRVPIGGHFGHSVLEYPLMHRC